MTEIKKDCTTCIHEKSKCTLCIDFCYHEFKCDYCKYRLLNNKKFCEMENEDGSQNCCGDHLEFNEKRFKIID